MRPVMFNVFVIVNNNKSYFCHRAPLFKNYKNMKNDTVALVDMTHDYNELAHCSLFCVDPTFNVTEPETLSHSMYKICINPSVNKSIVIPG